MRLAKKGLVNYRIDILVTGRKIVAKRLLVDRNGGRHGIFELEVAG